MSLFRLGEQGLVALARRSARASMGANFPGYLPAPAPGTRVEVQWTTLLYFTPYTFRSTSMPVSPGEPMVVTGPPVHPPNEAQALVPVVLIGRGVRGWVEVVTLGVALPERYARRPSLPRALPAPRTFDVTPSLDARLHAFFRPR